MLHLSMQAHIAQRQSLIFTPQLQQAIKLLLLNNLEMAEYAEKMAEENPFLEVDPPKGVPNLPMTAGANSDVSDFDPIALIVDASEKSFHVQVFKQVDELLSAEIERSIGYALASHLEPTGWLTTPLEQIARNLGVCVLGVEEVLVKLQCAEPAGLFARGLTECLKLQVRGAVASQAHLIDLIDNLELVQAGNFSVLRRKLGCSKEELSLALRALRNLDPKPGLSLTDGEIIPLREPDLRTFQGDDGVWKVELNRATLPAVSVDETLGRRVRKLTMQEADREFVRGALGTARWLSRAVAQRNETSIKVAAEIVRFQKGFLEHGMKEMRPLKLKAIADAVGVHESTISRVTSAMMMQTPQGCFPLKIFFSTAIDREGSEEGASARMIREKIRAIVADEAPQRPLSDDTITRTLREQGLHIARRTIAKYRKLDSIPSSSQRRRSYKLSAAL